MSKNDYNLNAEKLATIARLEAIERVGLDIRSLNDKLADLDVVKLIEDHVKAEVAKIEKLAKKHSIPLTINADELVATVKLPGATVGGLILPFIPASSEIIYDTNYGQWKYDANEKRFIPESDWEESWSSSSSNC